MVSLLMLLTTGWAQDLPPLHERRGSERVRVLRYRSLDPDPPARPRTRRQRGDVLAATFPDGQLLWAVAHKRGVPTTSYRWDAGGARHSTVHWQAGQPTTVDVHGLNVVSLETQTWTRHTLEDGFTAWLPPTTQKRGDTLVFETEAGDGWLGLLPRHDQSNTDLLRDLVRRTGARVEDRREAWLSGMPSERVRVLVPTPSGLRVSEVWLHDLPETGLVLILSWRAPRGELPLDFDTLATGRAVAALLQSEEAS